MQTKYDYVIGIDTGVNTGYAVYNPNERNIEVVSTMAIDEAMEEVLAFVDSDYSILVVVEDARLRKFFKGENMQAKQQGAGSIKRDAKIWEDFLKRKNIDYKMVNPTSRKTKINKDYFQKLTGYNSNTSEHGRDAAMLVFGHNGLNIN